MCGTIDLQVKIGIKEDIDMSWLLRVKRTEGPIEFHQFDEDELGTLDDKLTSLFITDLIGIDKIIIDRRKDK